VTLELVERGQGRPILWLHGEDGLDPSAPFIDLLAAHGRVVAPSHPGFGHSPDANNIDSVDDLAYLYLDLLAERNLRDVIVIGSSLGGWIAAEIATVNAALFSRMVLVGAAGVRPDDGEIWDYFVHSNREAFTRTFWDPPNAPEHARFYGDGFTPEDEAQAEWNREMAARLLWKPYMRSHTLPALLGGIATPTLVVWGREDAIIPLAAGERYAGAIRGAKLCVIDRCGHLPDMERPEAFVRAVREFLLPTA
jgi:pimeloyl-ACP methyl ester carboxylesterase